MSISTCVRSLVLGSLLVGGAVEALSAAAQEPQSQVARAVFGHYDQSGVPGKEIVTGTVTLQPGAEVAFHVHPGDEAGYVVQGAVTWKVRGQPDKTLHAGDGFFNPRGSAHSLVATESGARVFSAWIVDKGKPLSSPP
jgi:quercetin dioxygenase-like cupin family protein